MGITRAKKRLYLLHASQRSLWGRAEPQIPSRFLDELPSALLSGMVNRRGRRESAYRRATSWDEGLSGEDGDWGGSGRQGSRRRPDDGGRAAQSRESAGRPGATYWTPGGEAGSRGGLGAPHAAPSAKGVGVGGPQFKRRDSVQHPKFGVGTVIESSLVGGDEEVTVAFPGIGIKRLAASLAGLKKL